MASGAPTKVIWQTSSRRIFYNTLVARLGQYPTCIKANLLRPFITDFNIDDRTPPKPEIQVSGVEENRIDQLFRDYHLSADDFIVTLAPTHRRVVRRWPLVNFMDAAHYLIEKYHAKVILTWGPGEEGYLAPILESQKEKSPHLITDVFLNLLELTALMRRAKLHIGNDSAPCHIAVSQNLPTFTIYGATTSGWSYPSPRHGWVRKELDCQPCKKNVCRVDDSIPCLSTLTLADIQPKLDAFIEKIVLDGK
jgi:heptosyltransferase-2/heptosyltransferase-3